MSIFNILNQGARAMGAASIGINASSNNVANVNTPGYARGAIGLEAAGSVASSGLLLGQGVAVTDVISTYDRFSQGAVYREMGTSSYETARSQAYEIVELSFVEGDTGGLGAAVTAFFDSWSALEADPSSQAYRLGVLAEAQTLSQRFETASTQTTRLQANADAQVVSLVDQANTLAEQIASLNGDIALLEASGQSAVDLRARRTAYVEQLAELGPTRVEDEPNGTARVFFADQVLVDADDFRSMSAVVDATTGFHQVHISQGSTTLNITSRLGEGEMGANVDLRDNVMAGILSNLDTLAFEIASQVNTAHSAGFGSDGVTGRDFFTPIGAVAGAAQALSLDAAIDGNPAAIAASSTVAGLPGDNINATAIAGLADQDLMAAGTQTFQEFYAGFLAGLGNDAQVSYTRSSRAELQLAGAQDLRDSISGVSLEEEAMDIIRFKDAYQAAARVVSTVNELLDELMRIV